MGGESVCVCLCVDEGVTAWKQLGGRVVLGVCMCSPAVFDVKHRSLVLSGGRACPTLPDRFCFGFAASSRSCVEIFIEVA